MQNGYFSKLADHETNDYENPTPICESRTKINLMVSVENLIKNTG